MQKVADELNAYIFVNTLLKNDLDMNSIAINSVFVQKAESNYYNDIVREAWTKILRSDVAQNIKAFNVADRSLMKRFINLEDCPYPVIWVDSYEQGVADTHAGRLNVYIKIKDENGDSHFWPNHPAENEGLLDMFLVVDLAANGSIDNFQVMEMLCASIGRKRVLWSLKENMPTEYFSFSLN